MHFNRVTLILGGSGITPGYQLVARILETKDDDTQIAVIDANKSEGDILLKEELQSFRDKHGSQFRIEHVPSLLSEGWGSKRGHVNADIIKEIGFEPQD